MPDPIMSPNGPLPDGSVRLLRLLPRSDERQGIECELFTCAILRSGGIHPYDALSYVWGSVGGDKTILVDHRQVSVRANLHVALSHLQDDFVERILWIDAICINQDDNHEKGLQVQAMAKIYSKANRVIVWLGEEADDSSRAFRTICAAAQSKENASEATNHDRSAVHTLLERPWFQRIWVLQEVAAARGVLIKCGRAETDGHVFYLGIQALELAYEESANLQGVVRPMLHLIRDSIFRPRYEEQDLDEPARFSLNVAPLSELIDMYHLRKATEPHDKVYALLGMRSDNHGSEEIAVNYSTPWSSVFKRVVRFFFSDQQSVFTSNEVVMIKGKSRILGQVVSVRGGGGTQVMDVFWKEHISSPGLGIEQNNVPKRPPGHGIGLRASARPIRSRDILCLMQGAALPTIVRVSNSFVIIIRIAVPELDSWREWWESGNNFSEDIAAIWDWGMTERRETAGDVDEQAWMDRPSEREVADCCCQANPENATTFWKFGMLLNALDRYREAWPAFEKAVEHHSKSMSADEGQLCLAHRPWKEANMKLLNILDDMRSKASTMSRPSRGTPIVWAVEEGVETMVQELLQRGEPLNSVNKDGLTLLIRAIDRGQIAVVRTLLDMGATQAATPPTPDGEPLRRAIGHGHLEIAELLLERGAVINPKDPLVVLAASQGHWAFAQLMLDRGAYVDGATDGMTALTYAASEGNVDFVQELLRRGARVDGSRIDDAPLKMAAINGHEAIVRVLLENGARIDGTKFGAAPLTSAASRGHESIVRLLLDKGARVDGIDSTAVPLFGAISNGYEAIVRLLLERGATIDIRGRKSPLIHAAAEGHVSNVRLLLDHGADINAVDDEKRTPLSYAAAKGHNAIVQLLIDKGADLHIEDNHYEEAGALGGEKRHSRGTTAMDWAIKSGHEATVQLLRDAEAGRAASAKWPRKASRWPDALPSLGFGK